MEKTSVRKTSVKKSRAASTIPLAKIPTSKHHPVQGQWVGYVRVSSFEQNAERQLENVAVDRTFTDKALINFDFKATSG